MLRVDVYSHLSRATSQLLSTLLILYWSMHAHMKNLFIVSMCAVWLFNGLKWTSWIGFCFGCNRDRNGFYEEVRLDRAHFAQLLLGSWENSRSGVFVILAVTGFWYRHRMDNMTTALLIAIVYSVDVCEWLDWLLLLFCLAF